MLNDVFYHPAPAFERCLYRKRCALVTSAGRWRHRDLHTL